MQAAQTEPAVSCRGLRKIYDARRGAAVVAVDGIDLAIRRGECYGLLGPNGAGKTTTVEILEGILEPSAGEVELLGMSWARDDHRLRERIGVALQETRLPERLSVREVLDLFRSFYRRSRPVAALLADVELTEKRDAWVGKLSGGQRQRLAIACALVGEPDILFLDEPTTGLDPQSRRQLWDLVLRFRAAGGTVVLTTHYMEEAERLCDRVAIVDHGRIIKEGSPAELIRSLGAQHVIEFKLEGAAAVAEADLRALPAVTGARIAPDGGVRADRHRAGARAPGADRAGVGPRRRARAPRDTPRDPGGRVRHPDRPAPARWLMKTADDDRSATRPHPIFQLTLMRLRELSREPGTLFWVFGFPILMSIALGLAFRSTGPEPVRVGALPGVSDEVTRALAAGGVKVTLLDEARRAHRAPLRPRRARAGPAGRARAGRRPARLSLRRHASGVAARARDGGRHPAAGRGPPRSRARSATTWCASAARATSTS